MYSKWFSFENEVKVVPVLPFYKLNKTTKDFTIKV